MSGNCSTVNIKRHHEAIFSFSLTLDLLLLQEMKAQTRLTGNILMHTINNFL